MNTLPLLVLASTSPYRSELLKKMGINFKTLKPTTNEETLKSQLLQLNKTPVEIAENLSREKAKSVFTNGSLVIAGDQLVSFEGQILGKPHTEENAIKQLSAMNGKTHELITATTVMSETKTYHLNHITRLKMNTLSKSEITNYIKRDLPLDSAGSYKIENSGICLFEQIQTDDFSAIQGLPLIWLTHLLKGCGYELFKY